MKKKLVQFFVLLVFGTITTNNNLVGQSLILNGDFSAGINTNWTYRPGYTGNDFSEQDGALKAVITVPPTEWYSIGIMNSKTNNTIATGQTVLISFKAQTSQANAKLKLVMFSPQIDNNNVNLSFSTDITLNAGSKVYTVELPNTQATRSNWEFNLFYLNTGTFLIDDIKVSMKNAVNVATSAIATANVSDAGHGPEKAIDGIRDPWSGWNASTGDPTIPLPYWFELTWNTPQPINNVVLYTINNASYAIKGYTIQYWDGAAYQNLETVSGNTSSYISSYFNTVTTTKIRILCTEPDAGSAYYRIDEIEVYNNITSGINRISTGDNENSSLLVYSKSNETIFEAKEDIHQIQVYSLSGAMVFTASQPMGTKSFILSTGVLKPGIYLVVVNGINRQKFSIR
jgi:hypothetical protein